MRKKSPGEFAAECKHAWDTFGSLTLLCHCTIQNKTRQDKAIIVLRAKMEPTQV